jgi:hypothetical protein
LKGNFNGVVDNLRAQDIDLWLLDYYLPSDGQPNGITVAEALRGRGYSSKIVLLSGAPMEFLQISDIDKYKAANEYNKRGILNDIIDKGDKDIFSKIREHAYRPATAGVIGLGIFGDKLSEYLCLNSGIKSVKTFGERRDAETAKQEMRIRLERRPEVDKILPQTDLEGMLDVDLLFICSSAKRGPEIVEIGEREGRQAIFSHQYKHSKKISENLKEKAREDHKRIIIDCNNPVGCNIEEWRRFYGNPFMITYSFKNDINRIHNSLIESGFNNQEILSRIHELVVGEHGTPKVVTPQGVTLTPDEAHMIRDAEMKASKVIPRESQELAHKSGRGYFVPQADLMEFVDDFVNYRERLTSNAYCFMNFHLDSEYRGYVAVPAQFNFKKMEIKADQERIRNIGREQLYRTVAPMLAQQENAVEDVLVEDFIDRVIRPHYPDYKSK